MWPVCFFVKRVGGTDAPFQKKGATLQTLLLNISDIVLEVMDNSGFTAAYVNREKTERCLLPVLRKKIFFFLGVKVCGQTDLY